MGEAGTVTKGNTKYRDVFPQTDTTKIHTEKIFSAIKSYKVAGRKIRGI